MPHCVLLGPGKLKSFHGILEPFAPKQVFLVAGPHAYIGSGAQVILDPLFNTYGCDRFQEFSPNPQLADIENGVKQFRASGCDMIVAVGGGSAMDVAKFINLFAVHEAAPMEILKNSDLVKQQGVPLIAVPTTAGSGSEATRFGVMYVDKTKQSFSHPYLLPDVAVVDPDLLTGCSSRQMAVSGLDALSQAVESYWGIHADQASQTHARMAIELVLANLKPAVTAPRPEHRLAMSKAAYLAGKAINTTRTSGPHAFSYNLTAHFNMAHGHAVALTLGEFLVFNCGATASDTLDSRGPGYLQQTMSELIAILGVDTPRSARQRLQQLMADVGVETSLTQLGITSQADLKRLSQGINPESMANHPRRVTTEFLDHLIDRIA